MFISTLIFFAILVFLVLVHEFGHFIVAKWSGIRVDEFAFGFPPKLFGKKIGETEYRVNLLPIGGYVKIYGEDPNEITEGPDRKRSFAHKPRYIQALVLLAGITMNIIFAWVLFSGAYLLGAETSVAAVPENIKVQNERTAILNVAKGSPAEILGIGAGDSLVSLATFKEFLEPKTAQEVSDFVARHQGEQMTIGYKKKGEDTVTYSPITPQAYDGANKKIIGLTVDRVGVLDLPVHLALWQGMKTTASYTVLTTEAFINLIKNIFTGQGGVKELSGPIGIVGVVDQVRVFGIAALFTFAAIISINLAVLNLIPFPALDGGRLLFVAIESIIRRPLPLVFQAWANTIGFGLLLLLMVLVTWQDISRLIS
jgi:regulator of sigma E protease